MKNRLNEIINPQLDNTFIELNSPTWRSPSKLSLQNLKNALSINPQTLQVEMSSQGVNYVNFDQYNISYTVPPKSSSEFTGVTLSMDENYLYIWIEKQKRWKRIPLSEW